MLLTKKYGIPSVKYNEGTHTHGDIFRVVLIYLSERRVAQDEHSPYIITRARDYWKLARLSSTSAWSSISWIAWYGK